MVNYYEKTLWDCDKLYPDEELNNELTNELKDKIVSRKIQFIVLSQIKKICKNDDPIYFDETGMLKIKPNLNISIKENEAISFILYSYYSGTYIRHQFHDIEDNNISKAGYIKWFNKAKEDYLYTMPVKELLNLSDYDKNGNLTNNLTDTLSFHESACETTNSNHGIKGYSIDEIKYILEYCLDPYTILSIIGNDVHIEDFDKNLYAVCTTDNGTKLIGSLCTKELFYLRNKKLVSMGNSYEYLFKHLHMPIEKVLNSTLIVRDNQRIPSTRLKDCNQDKDLENSIDKAINSPRYDNIKKLTKTSNYWKKHI